MILMLRRYGLLTIYIVSNEEGILIRNIHHRFSFRSMRRYVNALCNIIVVIDKLRNKFDQRLSILYNLLDALFLQQLPLSQSS